MNNNDLNNQLRVMAGGGVVMDTSQLAMALSMNPKVISKMRQEGSDPAQANWHKNRLPDCNRCQVPSER